MKLRRRAGLPQLLRSTVIAHLTTDVSIKGVLDGIYADCIVLVHARHLDENADLARVVIPRERVAFLQDVPAAIDQVRAS